MNPLEPGFFAGYTRGRAALVHLGASVAVAALVVAVMVLVWYPSPWFTAARGGTLLLLIVGVDVVLGPLLTFVVFDPAKKSLGYDLAVIVMLQVAALVYGVHVMAASRPAFVVYLNGAFDVVAANDVETDDIAQAKLPEFQSVPWTGPRLAATRVPVDPGLQLRIGMQAMQGGPEITAYPQYYIPYATASRDAAARGAPLAQLGAEFAAAVTDLAATSGRPVDTLVYLPLKTRKERMIIVLGKAEGDIVGVLPLSPR